MCDRAIFKDPFPLVYFPDKYKTQIMFYKAVDDCLVALKFIPDWFVTSKIIKRLLTALYSVDNILYFHDDSGDTISFGNGMGFLCIALDSMY